MPDPVNKIAETASPGKQLGEIGDGMKKAAEGSGEVLNQVSNNKNNRVVIGLLIAVIVGLVFIIRFVLNNGKGIEGKADASTEKLFKNYEKQLADKDTLIAHKDLEIAEYKIANRDLNEKLHKAESANEQSLTKIDRALNMYQLEKNKKK